MSSIIRTEMIKLCQNFCWYPPESRARSRLCSYKAWPSPKL